MTKQKHTIPVSSGEKLELTVDNQSSSGDGVYKYKGYTLFVPGGLPGDKVFTEVIKITPRFGVTRVIEQRSASPYRVEPPCPVFIECGGCKFQDLKYEKQMEFKVSVVKDKAVVDFTNKKSAKRERIECDKVLVAVGRQSNISTDISRLGIKLDNQKKIQVNEKFETSIKNIYAIGDVINKGPMLAHKAEEEGIAVAEIIAGQAGHVNYDVIPAVIYTSPEVAMVGKTEEQLKKENIKYNIGKFPFLANSRAKVNNDTEGFVKIIAEAKTDKVLSVSIIGSEAGTMIAELALAMEFGASAEDIARTCHPHPSRSEGVKEAAMAVDKRPIHF